MTVTNFSDSKIRFSPVLSRETFTFKLGITASQETLSQSREIVLLGRITPEWSLIDPLSATVEIDEDGSYVISDEIFTAYGVGDSYDEAYQDYIASLIETYLFYKGCASENSASQEYFQRLQSYLRPL